ncbi:hypothetical protein I6N90_01955 [Paenibacillus sp. GSMTC-2017]|nr:hypothetical protein [Paenibacillus sp. GSMTC-2017]
MYDAPEIDGKVFVLICSTEIGSIGKVRINHA